MSTAASADSLRRARRAVRRTATALLALPFALGLVLLTTLSSARPAVAAGPEITGGGSSYAAVAIEQWSAEVNTIYGDSVNYTVSSSVQGMNEFSQSLVNFGASEIGYSTGQASYNPPGSEHYQYLPDVAGATCLMYNLQSITSREITTLRLTSQVMALVFSGQIKYWDAPAIRAINPGVLLPHKPIVVVWREDPSGDNYLFSQYLAFEQPHTWNPFAVAMGYPPGHDAVWPFPQKAVPARYNLSGWIGAQGSDIASNDVAGNDGAITYVETAYALLHNKPCAYIQNRSGTWVAPSEYDDSVALTGARLLPDLEQQLDGVYTNPSPYAYPISAYSYLITQTSGETAGEGAVLGRFIRYLACDGQQAAGQLGYAPLPPNLVKDDFQAIDRINGAAKAPSAPTAANCKNPYVDGQTPLPGQPQQSGGGGGTTTGGGGGTTTGGGGGTTTGGGGGGTTTGGGGGGTGHGGKSTHGKHGNGKSKGKGTTTGVATGPPPGGAKILGSGTPKASKNIAGLALLGAVGQLQRQVGPRPSTLLWTLLAAAVILGAPPLLLALRARRLHRKEP